MANYAIKGGIFDQKGDLYAPYAIPEVMFDRNSGTFWHSKDKYNSAVTVTFNEVVKVEKLEIQTRGDGSNERYRNVCLYADDFEIYCTGRDSNLLTIIIIFPS